jgi:hypothetical protein
MSKQLVPTPIIPSFPFQVFITKDYIDNQLIYNAAVHFNSKLLSINFFDDGFIPIKGLDQIKQIPESTIKQKSVHCILEVKIESLYPRSAKINWVEGENEKETKFIEFGNNYIQKFARVTIASLYYDKYATPGFSSKVGEDGSPSVYVYQQVNTNLVMSNMILDTVPVVYPVPFGGLAFKRNE